jgi:hypothetical protein
MGFSEVNSIMGQCGWQTELLVKFRETVTSFEKKNMFNC